MRLSKKYSAKESVIIIVYQSTMTRCSYGHMFDHKIHGGTCPYCPKPKADPATLQPENITNTTSLLARCSQGHLYDTTRHGELCPYCPKMEEDITQEEAESEVRPIKPVIGWLYCLKGFNEGTSYRLVAGQNFIGSAQDMHVRILDDPQIDKNKHGIIIFDPKSLIFYLLPGESRKVVYLNDKIIHKPTELNDRDLIGLSTNEFLFIAFCGQEYYWED